MGPERAPGKGVAGLHSDSPLNVLPGLGARRSEMLARLNLHRLQDLYFHLPLRYLDKTRLLQIRELRHGKEGLVCGVLARHEILIRRRRMLELVLQDDSGPLNLRFFHFAHLSKLRAGQRVLCYGTLRWGNQGPEMIHPELRILPPKGPPPLETTLTPVYPTTEGISQYALRGYLGNALRLLRQGTVQLPELLPRELLEQQGFPPLYTAILQVHTPPPGLLSEDPGARRAHPVIQRIVFEELLAHNLALQRIKRQAKQSRATALPNSEAAGTARDELLAQLPFKLTNSQRKVSAEIQQNLARPAPMMRLLQGDVGSGKTVVAAIAVSQAIAAGRQAAVMAPTGVLARQLHQHLQECLAHRLELRIELLSSALTRKQRADLLARIAAGESDVVVGTHSLLQEGIHFPRLALVVIDEQHKFGVQQRFSLLGGKDDTVPHQLLMSATPIPRTLAVCLYADLDVSTLDELPTHRRPVETHVMPNGRRAAITKRVREICLEGNQAFWICGAIEESEATPRRRSAEQAYAELRKLPGLNVGLLHGRMKNQEKENVMERFKQREIDLLVATTVVEVGVDVPNATLMLIEDAENLGLSQLHQLRGRVGRGRKAGTCVLLYAPPLTSIARQRLDAIAHEHNGFKIAEQDLLQRGPGELHGSRQTGMPRTRVVDFATDRHLLPQVAKSAKILLAEHPEQAPQLIARWLPDETIYTNA